MELSRKHLVIQGQNKEHVNFVQRVKHAEPVEPQQQNNQDKDQNHSHQESQEHEQNGKEPDKKNSGEHTQNKQDNNGPITDLVHDHKPDQAPQNRLFLQQKLAQNFHGNHVLVVQH